MIAFGPLCYGFAEGIVRCDDISQLRFQIENAITNHRPNKEALLRLLAAVLNTAHIGQWHSPLSTPGVVEPKNLALIALALRKEMESPAVDPAPSNEEHPLKSPPLYRKAEKRQCVGVRETS